MSVTRHLLWGGAFWGCMAFIPLGLGFWQVERLAWKTQLLANLETAYRADPVKFDLDYAALFPNSVDDTVFIRGTLQGELDDGLSFLIGPRSRDGQVGYHWYSFLRLAGQDAGIWVDRGFVPEGFVPATMQKKNLALTGLAYQTKWPGVMRDFSGNLLKHPVIRKSTESSSLVFRSETPTTDDARVSVDTSKPAFRNDHLSYAIFWFGLAIIAVLIGTIQLISAYQKRVP